MIEVSNVRIEVHGRSSTLKLSILDRYRERRIGIDLTEIEAHQYLGELLEGTVKELCNLITAVDRCDTSLVGGVLRSIGSCQSSL